MNEVGSGENSSVGEAHSLHAANAFIKKTVARPRDGQRCTRSSLYL